MKESERSNLLKLKGTVIHTRKTDDGMKFWIFCSEDKKFYACLIHDEYKPERCGLRVEAELKIIEKQANLFSSPEEEYEVISIKRI